MPRNWRKLLVLGTGFVLISFLNLGLFSAKLNDALKDLSLSYRTVENLVFPAVYAADTHQVSDPGFIRLGLWQGTFRLITSSPKVFLIGTGPETFPYAFQSFRPAVLNYSSEWEFVFNKPHNYYLEMWSEEGFLALLAYGFLLVYLYKRAPDFIKPILLVYVVSNFFGWPVVATSLYFWFISAFILKQTYEQV